MSEAATKASASASAWNLSAYANAPKLMQPPAPEPTPAAKAEPEEKPDTTQYITDDHRARQLQRVNTLSRI